MFKRFTLAIGFLCIAAFALAQSIGPGGNVIPPGSLVANLLAIINPAYVRNSVADLQAISTVNLTAYTSAETLGYYAANDGGAGTYYLSGAPCGTTGGNGGSQIAPTDAASKCWLLVNLTSTTYGGQWGIVTSSTDVTTRWNVWWRSWTAGTSAKLAAGVYHFGGILSLATPPNLVDLNLVGVDLTYNGTSTTGTKITIGTPDLGCSFQHWTVSGWIIRSLTAMTDSGNIGTNFFARINGACVSVFDNVTIGGDQINGDFTTYNNIWFYGGNSITANSLRSISTGRTGINQGYGIELGVSGDAAQQMTDFLLSGQSDILNGMIGIDVGGNVGGMVFGDGVDVINNKYQLKVSQDLYPAGNIQVFTNNAYFDVTEDTSGTRNILITDPGVPGSIFTGSGTWLSNSRNGACFELATGADNWIVTMTGGQFLGCNQEGFLNNSNSQQVYINQVFMQLVGTAFSAPTGSIGLCNVQIYNVVTAFYTGNVYDSCLGAEQMKVVSGSTYTLDNIRQSVCVNKTSGSATTINIFNTYRIDGTVRIMDCKGDAATNNITVSAGGTNINAATTYTINTNYGSVLLDYNGTQWIVLAAH